MCRYVCHDELKGRGTLHAPIGTLIYRYFRTSQEKMVFEGAGTEAGLEIWRIEVQGVPEELCTFQKNCQNYACHLLAGYGLLAWLGCQYQTRLYTSLAVDYMAQEGEAVNWGKTQYLGIPCR